MQGCKPYPAGMSVPTNSTMSISTYSTMSISTNSNPCPNSHSINWQIFPQKDNSMFMQVGSLRRYLGYQTNNYAEGSALLLGLWVNHTYFNCIHIVRLLCSWLLSWPHFLTTLKSKAKYDTIDHVISGEDSPDQSHCPWVLDPRVTITEDWCHSENSNRHFFHALKQAYNNDVQAAEALGIENIVVQGDSNIIIQQVRAS